MPKKATVTSPKVVVAGDVCLDVVGAPKPGKTITDGAKDNWRLAGEMRTYYFTGGASLLARFIGQATGDKVTGPQLPRPAFLSVKSKGQNFLEDSELGRLTSDEVVHSILELCPDMREIHGKKSCQWRVKNIHGFSGPEEGDPSLHPVLEGDTCTPDLLLLDDTGNGFRRTELMWPCALKEEGNPGLIIHKLHCPLPEAFPTESLLTKNLLWDLLRQKYEARSIVVVDINDLRAEGAMISCGLSWEKTVLELLWHLRGNPRFASLRECRHLVVRIGMDGALYYYNPGREYKPLAWLIYDPKGEEGGFKLERRYSMVGLGAAFTAALGAHLLSEKVTAEYLSFTWDDKKKRYDGDATVMLNGIVNGLGASRKLFLCGFGEGPDPAYPEAEIFDNKDSSFSTISVPIFADAENPDPVNWSILDTFLPEGSKLDEVAADFARKKKVSDLAKVPAGVFKFLTTYDRHEIEAYRAISTLMREYLQNPAPKRPLSLAVFGPPGSGKSFGVQNVVEHVQGENKVETLTFNLSQFQTPDELAAAFHLVRNAVVRGRVPLVFFDEFDTTFQERELGWLRYFLAPMQDGVFLDRGATHPIGKAIFVFAGGIFSSYEKFDVSSNKSKATQEDLDKFKKAKGTDFVSRLRGSLDIVGIDHQSSHTAGVLLRRAGILVFQLNEKAPGLKDSAGVLQIEEGVLSALLHVPSYHHGARSMEAILDMSSLGGCNCYSPSRLPQPNQLTLHVNEKEFNKLVRFRNPFGSDLEMIAEAIHKDFVSERKKDKTYDKNFDSHQTWKQLSEQYKESNRDQARRIPARLMRAGFYVRRKLDGEECKNFEFSSELLERLAKEEHERWMSEKLRQGWVYGESRDDRRKFHHCLLLWGDPKLAEEEKKDRQAIKMIPKYLEAGGWLVTE